ncbi:MAG: RNA-dependent RNA polymerase [Sanya narnavirus 11]|nr:MAG: RNA-dependent RNA polymerase [Sanya narnavirus 11]
MTPLLQNRNSKEPGRSSDVVRTKAQDGYLPVVHPNGDYVLRSRCFSVLDLKGRGVNSTRRDDVKAVLKEKRRRWLQTHVGLSRKSSVVLLERPASLIRRIEDAIHAIVDSMLLFCPEMFILNTPGRKTMLYLVRHILQIGPYDIGTIMMYWKEFTTFLYNRMAGFKPVLPEPTRKNFFWIGLRSHPDVVRMRNGEVDKVLCEKFAHLTSTRHLVSGDAKASERSLERFFQTIEEPFQRDNSFMNTIYEISKRLGEKCRLLPGFRGGLPHVSLNSAGSYFSTVKDGGRGREIREALTEVLTVIPEEDEDTPTPFGTLHCPKGKERWRYWARDVPYTWYEDTRFGDVITEEYFGRIDGVEQNLYYQGFDEAIGKQIVIVSYLKYEEWMRTGMGIPCRVLTVPEPGYKARIVTTGPFWLNVLQQSASHELKTILSRHPSARSSMMKTDQAWQALYLLTGKRFPEGSACLSSDLSEATDHIPKEVGYLLLKGFSEGAAYKAPSLNLGLRMLQCNREFVAPGHVSLTQTRGIMMGEPLTKVILTVLNLFVEEFAMRSFLHVSPRASFYESPPWRSYHVGGDDHLAVGPVEYLDCITRAHLMCGSKISAGKHGISDRVVKYCEKVLEVRKILAGFDVKNINRDTSGYLASPFVDSIKVRLLSPLSKALEVSSERNVAIGKGLSLGRTLKWMNPDHFQRKWIRMVRDRFFQRMGSLLPDRSSKIYWQLMLPIQWGGLDLYIPDEVEQIYNNLPTLTKGIMEDVHLGLESGYQNVKLLRKLLSNHSYRGYSLNETEVGLMRSHLEDVIEPNFPRATWKELQAEFNPEGKLSAKETVSLAEAEGWKGDQDIIDELMRPVLFKEILLGSEKRSVYNTEPLKKRYAKLWDTVFKGQDSLSLETFKNLVGQRPPAFFYKVGYPEEIHFVSDRGLTYKSALDDALHGMPVLHLKHPYC